MSLTCCNLKFSYLSSERETCNLQVLLNITSKRCILNIIRANWLGHSLSILIGVAPIRVPAGWTRVKEGGVILCARIYSTLLHSHLVITSLLRSTSFSCYQQGGSTFFSLWLEPLSSSAEICTILFKSTFINFICQTSKGISRYCYHYRLLQQDYNFRKHCRMSRPSTFQLTLYI